MMKRIVAVLAFIIAIGASFYVGQLTVDEGYTGPTELEDAVVLEVMDKLMEDHYSQPTEEELYQGMIDGMISSLEDPHTYYIDGEAYANFQAGFGESYVGIGVRVTMVNGLLIIEDVFPGSPAHDAGMQPNDIIAFVDGIDVRGDDMYNILAMILGDEGTTLTIGIVRAGEDEIITKELTRAVINNSSVVYTTYEENGQLIGYIQVNQFGDETTEKFADAIEALEAQNIDSMIIDLRNNGGGYLPTVTSMLQEFLVRDQYPMFYTEYYYNGTFYHDDYYGTRDEYKAYNIVTLVNGGSASASEVFASAMQEHGNYTLIGTTTYGKGTMQTNPIIQTTGSDRLHLSLGKWFTSDGNWVHFNGGTDGITPDIVVEQSVYETAYKMFLFDDETFVFDQVDERIENMQYILHVMGYVVRQDGYFDMATQTAIIDIQTNNGLTVNGIVDNDVLAILNDALDEFQDNPMDDSQLLAAIEYLVDHPDRD
ncbi:S41 family peptidase [Candidatus Xianfuyuplasma coldseepsis]|uniref:PDZ domain-containing protein n=1 Tax=Candidatus Xianfuyuplasma coldseepsis TaxID=2782163 RepID=A0A7L7KPW9_9MOLU|nr:S41 family peptidase [Xianfuyuplasma coldseepsis]QMS84302.1 PDZ domain-containing protein [Xianfuyuplasma coldseepsis]